MITKDNVTIQVDAVVYFQVIEPVRAVIGVDNFRFASQRIAMTSLRSIIGRYELDSLLAHREKVNTELRATIARSTAEWGVEVRQVEVRDITLPPELLRAMARQAEAERERRAKVIAATGELQASAELAEAADKLTASPGALQLRTLQTLAEMATERTRPSSSRSPSSCFRCCGAPSKLPPTAPPATTPDATVRRTAPALPTRSRRSATIRYAACCERSSAAEHQLPKLRTRVRFPSLARKGKSSSGAISRVGGARFLRAFRRRSPAFSRRIA